MFSKKLTSFKTMNDAILSLPEVIRFLLKKRFVWQK
jgi:hypothetical protein